MGSDEAEMTITEKQGNKTKPRRTAVFFCHPLAVGLTWHQPVTMVVWRGCVAMSSKGRSWRLFLRRRRFGRRFRRLCRRGRLLEVEVLQRHVQGHHLNTAHGLEVGEMPQRAVAVVLVLGGGGRRVLVGQQRGQQQLRHEEAPVGPLGLARLPLGLGQPRFTQPRHETMKRLVRAGRIAQRQDNTRSDPRQQNAACRTKSNCVADLTCKH